MKMKVKLSYSQPNQSPEAIKWLQAAEYRINQKIESQLSEYVAFGIHINYEVEQDESQ